MIRRLVVPVPALLLLLFVGCLCAVNPKKLHFDASETTRTFTLWIPGGEQRPTGWSIDAGVDWITVEPMMGNNYGDNTIYVTVDRTGLEPGDYSGWLCINTEHAGCACQVDITVEVTHESPLPYPDTGHVEGHVYDGVTDEGIAGVTVWVDSMVGVITEHSGHYELSHVPPGSHTIHALKEGYSDYSGDISVMSDLTTMHDISMFPS